MRLGRLVDLLPDEVGTHLETIFISDANRYSVIVALLAGVAGMISLTTAKSGALIGVLISVTTIPAAGNIGLAAAYGDWASSGARRRSSRSTSSASSPPGRATLAVQRLLFARRTHRT